MKYPIKKIYLCDQCEEKQAEVMDIFEQLLCDECYEINQDEGKYCWMDR